MGECQSTFALTDSATVTEWKSYDHVMVTIPAGGVAALPAFRNFAPPEGLFFCPGQLSETAAAVCRKGRREVVKPMPKYSRQIPCQVETSGFGNIFFKIMSRGDCTDDLASVTIFQRCYCMFCGEPYSAFWRAKKSAKKG